MPELGEIDFRREASLARQYIETSLARIIESYILNNVEVDDLIPPKANKIKIKEGINNFDNDYERKVFVIEEITAHDKAQLLLKNIKFLPQDLSEDIKLEKQSLLFITGEARAKIDAHTYLDRPVKYDQYQSVITFMHARVDTKLEDWSLLKDFFEEIQQLSYAEDDNRDVLINVPAEDYKITNFCGRSETFTKAYKLIVDQQRYLVSLVGIGGYGKTALANYLIRHINRKDSGLFKKIFWYSAKDSYVDESGRIENIVDPVKSLNEFINCPDEKSDLSLDDYVSKEGNILIVLDNFETMDEENAKIFIKKYASPQCRFLITSRKSIGELEEKINIEKLQDFEAKMMVTNYISTFNMRAIDEISEDQLMGYLNKLDNSPLHIKWFLNSIRKNNNIYELMSSGKRSDVIQFTFKNTLNDLSEASKNIIDVLLIQQKFVSILFIRMLTNIGDIEFDKCIKELKQSVLIDFQKQKISIRSEALDYFNSIGHEIKNYIDINKRINSLIGNAMTYSNKKNYEQDDFTAAENIVARDDNEGLAAAQLSSIFNKYRKKRVKDGNYYMLLNLDFNNKIDELKKLKGLMSNYSEIDYAIANTYFDQNDFSNAKTHAISGINLSKNSVILKRRLLHKLCMIYDKMKDYDNLLLHAKELYEIDKSPKSLVQLADAYGEIKDIEKSNEFYLKAIDGIEKSPYYINASAIATQIIGSHGYIITSYSSKDHYEKYWPELVKISKKLIPHFDLRLIKMLQKTAGNAEYKYSSIIKRSGLNSKIDFYDVFKDLYGYFKKNEPGSPCEKYLKDIDLTEKINKSDYVSKVTLNKSWEGEAIDLKALEEDPRLIKFLETYFLAKVENPKETFCFASVDFNQDNFSELTYAIKKIGYIAPSNEYVFIPYSVFSKPNSTLKEKQSIKIRFSYDLKNTKERRLFAVEVIL